MFSLCSSDDAKRLYASVCASQLSERAKKRLDWIVYYLENGKSISETCRMFSISRSTFYRVIERFDPADITSLEDKPHAHCLRSHTELPAVAMERIRDERKREPTISRERIAEILASECGIAVSPSLIGRIINREGLFFGASLAHQKKRIEKTAVQDVDHSAIAVGNSAPTSSKLLFVPTRLTLMTLSIGIIIAAMVGGSLTATVLSSPKRENISDDLVIRCEEVLRTFASVLSWYKQHGRQYEVSESEQIELDACRSIIDGHTKNKSSTLKPLGAALRSILSIPRAYAAEGIFKKIPYQGNVTLTSGAGMSNGQYNMRFKIFDAASGGTELWSETWDSNTQPVTMTGGLFTVYLGTHIAMNNVDFNTDSLYLQVQFDPGNDDVYEETFSPRRRFASVPYALNSDKVDGLDATQFLRSDASDVMSGSLLIHQSGQSVSGADARVQLEIIGTASGRVLHAQDLLTSSGKLIVEGTSLLYGYVDIFRMLSIHDTASGRVLHAEDSLQSSGSLIVEGETTLNGALVLGSTIRINGVTYTFPAGDGSASGKVLKTNGTGQLAWSSDTTGSTYYAGAGLSLNGANFLSLSSTLTGTSLEITGTASGRIVHAQDLLRSSGALIVKGTTRLQSGAIIRMAAPLLILRSSVTSQQWELKGGSTLSSSFSIYDATAKKIRFVVGGSDGNTTIGTGVSVSNSRLYVWGGPNGANIDVRGDASIVGGDQSTIELEGNNYDVDPNSIRMTYYGASHGIGTTMGYSNNKLGVLAWQGVNTAIIAVQDIKPLLFGTSNKERMRLTETGSLAIGTATPGRSKLAVSGSTIMGFNIGSAAADAGLALEVLGTASGRIFHAQDELRSSGTLIVDGTTTLNGALVLGSTIRIGGVTYTFPVGDGSASGKVLKTNGAGQLSWSTDSTGGGGSYYAGQGLSLNGSNFLSLAATLTGTSLEIYGTASGRILHAQDQLRSSGTLIVKGTTRLQSGAIIKMTSPLLGDGLQFIIDQSQISGPGRIMAIDDNVGSEIFAINKYGFIKTERGYVSYDGFMGQEFNDERASAAADLATRGDDGTWVFDEGAATSTCTDIVAEGSISFDRMTNSATQPAGCAMFMGIGVGDIMGFTNAANLPRTLIKIRPGRATADAHTWAGLFIDWAPSATEPTEGIYFTNAAGGTWTGRINPASGASSDVVCTGQTISTTQFAALEIIVESSTIVRFKVDNDLSNGINFVDCGTGNPSGVTSNLGAGVFMGTTSTTSFTMDTDYVRVWTDDPKTSGQSVVQTPETPTELDLTTSADLAEAYPAIDAGSFGAGELVSIDEKGDGSVRKSKNPYEKNLIGVVSASPYDVMGAQSENTVAIALAGRVPVRVSTENGPIAVGESITSSSKPGIGMRASSAGPIIGKAMQAYDGQGEGIIMVFVYAGDYVGDGLYLLGSGANTIGESTQNSGTSAEYAEWFKVSNDHPIAGEVVCIDPTTPQSVAYCADEPSENIVGIVATRAQIVGNEFTGVQGLPVPGHVLVGLMGQTTVKVTTLEGKSIRIGDALTAASTKGFARKSIRGEPTIGVALEEFTGEDGTISILISRNNASHTMQEIEQKILDTVASMGLTEKMQSIIAQSIDTLDFGYSIKEEVREQLLALYLSEPQTADAPSVKPTLPELLTHARSFSGSTLFAGNVEVQGALSVSGPVNMSGSLTVAEILRTSHLTASGNLTVGGSARIMGDAYVEGTLTIASLIVPDALHVYGDMTVQGFVQAYHLSASSGATIRGSIDIDTQTGSIRIGSGSISIKSGNMILENGSIDVQELIVRKALLLHGDITVEGLAVFLGNLEVRGDLILSDRQAGFAEIPAGVSSVRISYGTGFIATPIITATPMSRLNTSWWIDAVTSSGFTIFSADPVPQNALFSWNAMLTNNPKTFKGTDSEKILIDFPVDSYGVPLSSNPAWNACIRNQTLIDEESGKPFNCSRYHQEQLWTQPDLLLEFLYDPEASPKFTLPDNYRIVTIEDTNSQRDPLPVGDEEGSEVVEEKVVGEEIEEVEEVEGGEEVEEVEEIEEIEEVEGGEAESESGAGSQIPPVESEENIQEEQPKEVSNEQNDTTQQTPTETVNPVEDTAS